MTTAGNIDTSTDLHQFTLATVARVLGQRRAQQLVERLLAKLHIDLRTPDNLLLLAEEMSRLGGFEGAVGAMLGVDAVLRGARPSH